MDGIPVGKLVVFGAMGSTSIPKTQITDEWFDTKEYPPGPGMIVKRWNSGSVWAGYYDGSAKKGTFDQWIPLPSERI